MTHIRYKPVTIKNATTRAKNLAVWIVYDTAIKGPWRDPRNQVSTWFDVKLSCNVLNGGED